MPANLRERLQARRQFDVMCENVTLICRRPTDLEALELAEKRHAMSSERDVLGVIVSYVVGWRGVRECDLLEGESEDQVPFDKELLRDWLSDHSEFWMTIMDSVFEAYRAWKGTRDDAVKN